MKYIKLLCMLSISISISTIFAGKTDEVKAAEKECLSPHKKPVDWFVIFLYPETSNKDGKLAYGYFDNKSKDIEYFLYDEETFPSINVIEEYNGKETNYFFWNDDTSVDGGEKTSSSSGKAHSKGGLIYDKKSGLLISHSLPRFPRRTENNEIQGSLPSNTGIYGQTFICISLNKENALKVVETLNIINPPLVLNVDTDLTQSTPDKRVEKLIKNRFDSKLNQTSITEISSKAGCKFEIFSKGRNADSLPWDTQIPQHYKDGIYVETWTKPEMIPSTCDGEYQVINVSNLKFGKYQYDKNQEHSKWGVGIKKDICCFGDLNRTFSQLKRGGNVICLHNTKLAEIMRNAIVDKDDCPKKNKAFLEFIE